MVATPAVGNLIRENELEQMRSLLQTGRKLGMCTMNQAFADLHLKEMVSWEEIKRRSPDPEELSNLTRGATQP